MLAFGNKEFRNLQEQVLENMRQIDDIKQAAVVLDEFGIKVIGQIESADELPDPETYEGEFGDAYAVGTEAPYELYIWTRGDSLGNNAYWFDIGAFPQAGPQGQPGAQGEQGPSGTISFGTITTTTLQPSQSASVTATNIGTASNAVYNMTFAIPKGEQGLPGETGATGATGPQGPKGDKGEKGDTGTGYIIMGQLDSALDLPDPGSTDRQAAYLIGANEPYDLYVIVGTIGHLEWFDAGPFTTATADINQFEAGFGLTLDEVNSKIEYAVDTNNIPTHTDVAVAINSLSSSIASVYATQASLSSFQSDVSSAFTSAYAAMDSKDAQTLDWAQDFTMSYVAGLSSIYATPAYVDNSISSLSSVYQPIGNYLSQADLNGYATEVYVQNELSGYAKESELSNYTPLSQMSLYASVSAVESAISGVNATINSLNYLSVGALSSETVIPDITGLASEIYVDNSISALSSVYASISALPDMSLYAELSGSNIYTGTNDFNYEIRLHNNNFPTYRGTVTNQGGHIWLGIINGTNNNYYTFNEGGTLTYRNNDGSRDFTIPSQSGTLALLEDIPSASDFATLSGSNTFTSFNRFSSSTVFNGQTYFNSDVFLIQGTSSALFRVGQNVSTSFYGYVDFNNAVTFNSRTYFQDGRFMYGSDIATGFEQQLQSKSGTIALLDDIPSVSEYATVSALSSAIDGLSSVYAPLSADNIFTGSNLFSASVYMVSGVYSPAYKIGLEPGIGNLNTNGTQVQLTATSGNLQLGIPSDANFVFRQGNTLVSTSLETFTFTLSDNTTVSKTFLVG